MPMINFNWVEPERPHTGLLKPMLWLALTLNVLAYCSTLLTRH
ncbi:MAG TPA: hypothetical protein VMT68_06750 [Caulobacteraceae bacterium]|nr:hypothetical protein [Caulobacteraceae bacterium]